MIAFNDSDGNVTIVGQIDEWQMLFRRVEQGEINAVDTAHTTQYMLSLASSCNKFKRRRVSDTMSN